MGRVQGAQPVVPGRRRLPRGLGEPRHAGAAAARQLRGRHAGAADRARRGAAARPSVHTTPTRRRRRGRRDHLLRDVAERLRRRRSVVGRVVQIDGVPTRIVGIMPPRLRPPRRAHRGVPAADDRPEDVPQQPRQPLPVSHRPPEGRRHAAAGAGRSRHDDATVADAERQQALADADRQRHPPAADAAAEDRHGRRHRRPRCGCCRARSDSCC